MHCNGSCKKYKATSTSVDGGRYELGQKRCPECELFINWEGLWCPCCGRLLRTKPRAKRVRNRKNTSFN
ncbi:MAG: hypothetical protein EA443_03210 [Nitrosopumilus sp.]|nr:MAG: hypothetical protein EA443_03210 [Nitrosopumilus sp.]